MLLTKHIIDSNVQKAARSLDLDAHDHLVQTPEDQKQNASNNEWHPRRKQLGSECNLIGGKT